MKKQKLIMTLCIPCESSRVLLGMKKKGLGTGWWNGFGGKVEAGESIEAAAVRELEEESGIKSLEIERAGILEFHPYELPHALEVHYFRTDTFEGEPRETDEMAPQWFDQDKLPYDQMWPDDKFWFPMFLARKKFRGRFVFDKEKKITEWNLRVIKNEQF